MFARLWLHHIRASWGKLGGSTLMQNRCYGELTYYQLYCAVLLVVEIIVAAWVKSINELTLITAILWRQDCANVTIMSHVATPKTYKTLIKSCLITVNPRDWHKCAGHLMTEPSLDPLCKLSWLYLPSLIEGSCGACSNLFRLCNPSSSYVWLSSHWA